MTLKDIVDFYLTYGKRGMEVEFVRLDLIQKKANSKCSCYCNSCAKRDCLLYFCVKGGHQFRLKEHEIQDAVDALKSHSILSGIYKDFEDLYFAVNAAISKCRGIGDLTVYDTALRIGYLLKVLPKDYVYLYAGGYEGYKRVTNLPAPNYYGKNNISAIQSLDPEFKRLNAYEIEDFFCVCKNFFVNKKNSGTVSIIVRPHHECVKVEQQMLKDIRYYFDWNLNQLKNENCVLSL